MKRLRLLAIAACCAFALVALVSVALPGVVAAFAPDALVPDPDARSTAASAVLPVVGVLALVAAGFVGYQVRRGDGAPPPLVNRPVEEGNSDAVDVVGRRFRYTRSWSAEHWQREGTSSKAAELEARLYRTAVGTYAGETGVDRETARHAIDTGAWTDDPVAAWFLAADRGRPPGLWWLRERLRPSQSYRAYADRTAVAIDELRGGSP